MRLTRVHICLAVVLVGTGATGAMAAAGAGPFGAGDVFVGCVQKSSGQLRVIDPAAACSAAESRIEWHSASATLDADTLDGRDSTEFLAADGTAVNADRLDGLSASDLSLKCPSGMTRVEDLCHTERQADASYVSAIIDCANQFLRLPSPGELTRIFRNRTGLGLNQEFWTDDAMSSTTAHALRLNTFVFSDREAPRSEAIGFFCVESPQNAVVAASLAAAAAADEAPELAVE